MGIFDSFSPIGDNKSTTESKSSSPIFDSFKPIESSGKQYINPTLEGSFQKNDKYNVTDYIDANKDLQSDFTNAVNSFRKGIDQTQISNYRGKLDSYQETIDNNIENLNKLTSLYKQGKVDPSIYQNEVNRVSRENNEAQKNIDSLNSDISDNQKEIKDEYVSKLYQLKESVVQAKGGDAGLWESVKYTMPSTLGSSASLMGQQLAATFGADLAKKAITRLSTGLIGGPVGEGVAIVGTIGAIMGTLVNSRYQETLAEVGDQIDQNQANLLDKWMEENPGVEPSEDVLRGIRIQARKGKDDLFKEQMMLVVPDAIEALLMPGSKIAGLTKAGRAAERGLNALAGYNKFTRASTTIAKQYGEYLGEKFEEGFQYASAKRQEDQALNLNNYENKGFISNLLTDSHDVLSSISYGPWGTLQPNGRYSEDKEFQFAEQSGGLLSAISGGLASGKQIYSDIQKYIETNKELQESGIANPNDKFFRLKDQIYKKHFDNNTLEFLTEGINNLKNQKDANGNQLLSDNDANEEINNVKSAFDKYIKVGKYLDDIVPKGRFGLKYTKEQNDAIEAFKSELFHNSMMLTRHENKFNAVESIDNISDLIDKQSALVSKIEQQARNSKANKIYNTDSRLKIAKSKLEQLKKSKSDLLSGFNLKEKDLGNVSSIDESINNKQYLINDLNLSEIKNNYNDLLKIKNYDGIEKWYKNKLKKESELLSELDKDEVVNKDFAKEQEQRVSVDDNSTINKKDQVEKPIDNENKVSNVSNNDELDKIDKQEDAELEALYQRMYDAPQEDIDAAVKRVTDKYNERRNNINKKPVDFHSLVKNATSDRELDSIIDQSDKLGINDKSLIDEIAKKRKELLDEKSKFDESDVSNARVAYENEPIDALYDLQGKIALGWNKSIAGQDNDKKTPENRYFSFLRNRSNKGGLVEGTGLQLITRNNNKKLFDKLFDEGAKDYEEKTGIPTIYALFVDKDNNPIYADNEGNELNSGDEKNYVYATLLTELGVESTLHRIDKEKAKKELNEFRSKVLSSNKQSRIEILKISDGILIREKNIDGSRRFNAVKGRITNDIKQEGLLDLPVILLDKKGGSRLPRTGQYAVAGKLYAYDKDNVGIDLFSRNLVESEALLIVDLIKQRLGVKPKSPKVDNIGNELDKFIKFGIPKSGIDEFTIGIKDDKLYVGEDESFSKDDLSLNENIGYIMNFLMNKKICNVNSKIKFSDEFKEPILDKDGNIDYKKWSSYQEFLLSDDNRKPLFGTDIPEINKPRTRNYYVTYDTNITNNEFSVKDDELRVDNKPEESTEILSTETKKADIERRRQEELNIVNNIPLDTNISLNDFNKLGIINSSLFGQSLFNSIINIAKQFDIKIRFTNGVKELSEGAAAHFDSNSGTVLINLQNLYESYQNTINNKGRAKGTMLGVKGINSFNDFINYTITHELIHGVTQSAYNDVFTNTRKGVYSGKLNEIQVNAVKSIGAIFNYLKTLNTEQYFGGVEYGLHNMSELMAEMSNEGFVSALQRIQLPENLRYNSKNKNIFENIISFIRDLFTGKKVENNAAQSLFAAISDIITSPQIQSFTESNYTQNSTSTVQDKINAKYDAELDALETNKKDEVNILDNKEKITNFAGSNKKRSFKKSGKSEIIDNNDNFVSDDQIDDAIKKCE